MQSCRHLTLKSFIRIRGAAVPRPPSVDGGVRKIGATVRLELIAPTTAFCAKPINDIPILKTPLSVQVAQMHKSSHSPHGREQQPLFSSRTTGFLTLSKVRQAVLLLETDPDASVIPVVGVWAFVDAPAPTPAAAAAPDRDRDEDRGRDMDRGRDRDEDRGRGRDRDSGAAGSAVLAENAFVWAACCRYVHSLQVRERVWVAPNTFLMVGIIGLLHFGY
jgi:hypothetical protein